MSDMSEVLQSKQVEEGLAVALRYLQEELGCSIDSEPYDAEDIKWTTRSLSIDLHGPQRIAFTTEVPEALARQQFPRASQALREFRVAEFIQNSGRVPVIVTLNGPQEM
jgi:hypothetical protein